jgi:hypothetical protein
VSPNKSSPRKAPIRKITIHHTAGVIGIESLGNWFARPINASSNYGVGNDGRIGQFVDEKDRAWTSSSAANDDQAVTIEVSNSASGGQWPVSDKAIAATIDLCVDICRRNNIARLNYTGKADGNLTRHDNFKSTLCPGPYLGGKLKYIADEVNKRLDGTAATGIGAGSKVRIKPGSVYSGASSGKPIPDNVVSRVLTVGRVQNNAGIDGALLTEINSWVAVSSLIKA